LSAAAVMKDGLRNWLAYERPMRASAPTAQSSPCSDEFSRHTLENFMYIGGGILGTILVIALIVFLVRRA
jgi:hypothetical protein